MTGPFKQIQARVGELYQSSWVLLTSDRSELKRKMRTTSAMALAMLAELPVNQHDDAFELSLFCRDLYLGT